MQLQADLDDAPYSIPLIAYVPSRRSTSLFSKVSESVFDIHLATKAEEIATAVEDFAFSVVLVEAVNADKSAAEICNELPRFANAATVVISSSEFASGRINDWRSGADLVLPPNTTTEELLLSCFNVSRWAVMTRSKQQMTANTKQSDWLFEPQSFRLIHESGKWVRLSRNEAQVMSALCHSCNKLVRRSVLWRILDKADWRYNDRSLDVLIARIRAKMRKVAIDPNVILTHYGAGYELRINS